MKGSKVRKRTPALWVAMRASDLLRAWIGIAADQGLNVTQEVSQALLGKMKPSQAERAQDLERDSREKYFMHLRSRMSAFGRH